MNLPGLTDLSDYKSSKNTCLSSLNTTGKRKTILLATNDISDGSLYNNGLYQNILLLYNLFESFGYKCYLIQHRDGNSNKKSDIFNNFDIIFPDVLIKNPMEIYLYLEIGMSLDSVNRSYLRDNGAKIVKLYLGNILNIDIETVQNLNNHCFAHHIVGEVDEIWMSPHYKQNLDYGLVLNQVPLDKGRIVPYIWDSCFTNYFGSMKNNWKPMVKWEETNIILMDPNISFQKSYFYPLLLTEAFYRKYPNWKGNVIIYNGDRLNYQNHFKASVLPNLTLNKDNKIKYNGRKTINQIFEEYPSSLFITHQWNNSFNYMTFELMYREYPLLHNSDGWEDYGYHYSINNWDKAIDTLYNAIKNHRQNLNIYRSHAQQLIWNHSMYNPEIRNEWLKIIESLNK